MKILLDFASQVWTNRRNILRKQPGTARRDTNQGWLIKCFLGVTALGILGLCIAQEFRDEPILPDVIGGWDFTGMSEEQKLVGFQMVFPVEYNDELNKTKSPEQVEFEAQAAFAITNPEAYAAQHPVYKNLAQLSAEAAAAYAIANPVIHQAALDRQKSDQELEVELNWIASPESGVQYYVYRSVNNLDGPWPRIGVTASTSFNDNPAPSGAKMYQVRCAKLITTGSGSFTNLSQGIFVNVN